MTDELDKDLIAIIIGSFAESPIPLQTVLTFGVSRPMMYGARMPVVEPMPFT